jgi:hypothetical protein
VDEKQKLKIEVKIPLYLETKGTKVLYKKRFPCPSPNHNDKHPSCVVYQNPDGDYIRCFGCDLHGDIYTLVGLLEDLPNFKQQFNFLMENYGRRSS